jgi:hypothetical protein
VYADEDAVLHQLKADGTDTVIGGGGGSEPRVLWVFADAFFNADGAGHQSSNGLDFAVPCLDGVGVEMMGCAQPYLGVPAGAQFFTEFGVSPFNGPLTDSFSVSAVVSCYKLGVSTDAVLFNADPIACAGTSDNYTLWQLTDVNSTPYQRGTDIAVAQDGDGNVCFETTAGGDFLVTVFVNARLTEA